MDLDFKRLGIFFKVNLRAIFFTSLSIILHKCRLRTLAVFHNSKIVICMAIFVDFLANLIGMLQKIVVFTGSRELQ